MKKLLILQICLFFSILSFASNGIYEKPKIDPISEYLIDGKLTSKSFEAFFAKNINKKFFKTADQCLGEYYDNLAYLDAYCSYWYSQCGGSFTCQNDAYIFYMYGTNYLAQQYTTCLGILYEA